KLEKLETRDDKQQAELTRLQTQLAEAEQTLADAQQNAPAAPKKAADDEALKKAKIEAAMLRAQLRKLEKLETRDDEQQAELTRLQTPLAEAEQTLADAQQNPPAAPKKAADDEALKKAKTHAAILPPHRRKLEKLETRDDEQQAELTRLQAQLAQTEQ